MTKVAESPLKFGKCCGTGNSGAEKSGRWSDSWMNGLVNAATFAVATFAGASWRCEIFKEQDVGHCRNGLRNLKIVVRIWNATAVTACWAHQTTEMAHSRRQSSKYISGRHSEVALLSRLILLWPTSQFMLPEMFKEHFKYHPVWKFYYGGIAGTRGHVT